MDNQQLSQPGHDLYISATHIRTAGMLLISLFYGATSQWTIMGYVLTYSAIMSAVEAYIAHSRGFTNQALLQVVLGTVFAGSSMYLTK